jgi:hypothetical protein
MPQKALYLSSKYRSKIIAIPELLQAFSTFLARLITLHVYNRVITSSHVLYEDDGNAWFAYIMRKLKADNS